jgi:carboxyl-terminal processing protease
MTGSKFSGREVARSPGSINCDEKVNFLRRHIASSVTACAILLLWCASSGAGEKPFGGIGVQVVPTATGELVVLKVIAGTPAAKSGIQPGDLIVKVNEFPLEGSDFPKVVREHLWGPVGSEISLTYLRPGVAGMHSANFKRVPLDPGREETPGVKMLAPGQ